MAASFQNDLIREDVLRVSTCIRLSVNQSSGACGKRLDQAKSMGKL